MVMQAGKMTFYRTQDVPIALLGWAGQKGQVGTPVLIGVALENRSEKRLYLDIAQPPYGLVDEPHMPLKIEVWQGEQLFPYRGPIVKRPVLTDADLVLIYPGGMAGLFFELDQLGYRLSAGQYRVVLWYDSTGMHGSWVKTKRLWRGRTSKLEIPIEII
jgi:hypothetical protein